MISHPLISVVIPIYNSEKYLKKCLDSIINQSYRNIEIIAVDDGSSDNSKNIVLQYDKVKLVEHKINKGQSAARNEGIANSKGKYIHFMDSDDEINTTFYENLINASEKTNADIACCSYINQKTPNESQVYTKRKVYKSVKSKYRVTNIYRYGFAWRYLFKASFLKENKLTFEEGRLIEDMPFCFKAIFYANKVVTVPKSEYLYVYNPNSLLNVDNHQVKEKSTEDYEHSKSVIIDFAKKNGIVEVPGLIEVTDKSLHFLKKIKQIFKHLKF